MSTSAGAKRKDPSGQKTQGRDPKRAKLQEARAIRAQTSDAALSNGELNVEKFVKAREFEIRALEDGLKKARRALSTRAHQELPKELRRRTASHNAKRVPNRLQKRAEKEMKDDNTPLVTSRRRKVNGHQRLRLETAKRLQTLSKKSKTRREEKKAQKNESDTKVTAEGVVLGSTDVTKSLPTKKPKVKNAKLREPPQLAAKFRKRQIHKTWLPTHLWHSKRARMTAPKEPLWRFALPLTPNIKSYRNAHRSSADRGAIAWDTSYMGTISLEGVEASIAALLKALGVGCVKTDGDPWGRGGDKWRAGVRAWEGWLHERDCPDNWIAPVIIIWNPSLKSRDDMDIPGPTKPLRRKALIRVHPASFLQLWEQILRLAKVQKPSITVEDLRFEIGSIEISGPSASEVLVAILRPAEGKDEGGNSATETEQIWPKLSVLQASSLPANACLSMSITDPRLRHPPRTLPKQDQEQQFAESMDLLADWVPDRTQKPVPLFDRNSRLNSSRLLSSQKSVNRRKAQADPGDYPLPNATDPAIPIILHATRSTSGGSGTWTVMLPWKCVSPVWNSMVYYPLSTGGLIRFGGVQEKRQLVYESSMPWFPADFPATQAGSEWEAVDSARRKTEWDRKPKSRRTEYDSTDLGKGSKGELGMGWACDWQRLIRGAPMPNDAENGASEDMVSAPQTVHTLHQVPISTALNTLRSGFTVTLPENAITAVKVTMVGRGRPNGCARIYRLPTRDPDNRQKWLALQSTAATSRSNSKKSVLPPKPSPDASSALQRAWLAAMILTEPPEPGAKDYPLVPDEEDLVGFVTTGNYSLVEGKGVGIGSLLLGRVIPLETDWQVNGKGIKTPKKEHFLCVVRDAGESHGRLARWEFV